MASVFELFVVIAAELPRRPAIRGSREAWHAWRDARARASVWSCGSLLIPDMIAVSDELRRVLGAREASHLDGRGSRATARQVALFLERLRKAKIPCGGPKPEPRLSKALRSRRRFLVMADDI